MEKADFALSRRKSLVILGGGAAVAATAAMVSPLRNVVIGNARELLGKQPEPQRVVSLANGSYQQWLDQVGIVFSVGGGAAMRLAGVRAMNSDGARPTALRQTAFVAMFDALDGQTLASDLIYTVNHPRYGPLQIFMSASPDPATPARMHAVFN